ncbi:MAG: S41 family peptidase [Anaerolineae bacterium]
MADKTFQRLILILLVSIVAATSYLVGFASQVIPAYVGEVEESEIFHPAAEEPPEFAVYWEAWNLVEENFYGELPDAKTQTYGSIRGMLAALGDPNTFFIEPPDREIEEAQFQGRYGGIGAEYTMRNGYLVVVTPFEDSPASRAGIRPGDIIVAVDGTDLFGLSQNEAILLIRGPVGSEVELTIRREGDLEPLMLQLIREEIEPPTVTWELKEEGIGYLKLSFFGGRTNEELRRALTQLQSQGATSLILDLRNNPGGLIEAAVDIASQFIDTGAILYQRDAQGNDQPFPAKKGGLATETPLAVLVNGGTASAAEIVAGALSDHQRAVIIGEKTFGKGSIQTVRELSDHSSIHVTTAHWLTPQGHEIEGAGLIPDLEVPLTQEDIDNQRDPQLNRALAYLRSLLPYPASGGLQPVNIMSINRGV